MKEKNSIRIGNVDLDFEPETNDTILTFCTDTEEAAGPSFVLDPKALAALLEKISYAFSFLAGE